MARKKTTSANEPLLESFDTAYLPPPYERLTPERAIAWLRDEYPGWQALMLNGGDCGRDLAYWVGVMVEACQRAIETGSAVEVYPGNFHSESGSQPRWSSLEQPLCLLEGLLSEDYGQEVQGDLAKAQPAALALVRQLAAVVRRGAQVEWADLRLPVEARTGATSEAPQ